MKSVITRINPFKTYKLIIPRMVYEKIMYWVNLSKFEVSGFGRIEFNPETGEFTVLDAYLLEQENTASSTELDQEAICNLLFDTKDLPGRLSWWWHSHVDMPVFWSGTDEKTIAELSANGWIVASVFNKKKEIRTAFASKFEEFHMMQDEISTYIRDFIDPDLIESWKCEFEDKVTILKPKYTFSGIKKANRKGEEGLLNPDDIPSKYQQHLSLFKKSKKGYSFFDDDDNDVMDEKTKAWLESSD